MDFWSFFWPLVWSFFFVAYLMLLFHTGGSVPGPVWLGGFAKVLWVAVLLIVPLLALAHLHHRPRQGHGSA